MNLPSSGKTTRSGMTFSPFVANLLLLPNYDLRSSVQAALAASDYKDDPTLTAPPHDIPAAEFWQEISKLSLDGLSDAPEDMIDLSIASANLTDKAPPALAEMHDKHVWITLTEKVRPLKKGNNARVHAKRANRQAKLAKDAGHGFHPRQSKVITQVVERAIPIPTQLDTKNLPTTATGYTAQPRKCPGEGDYPDTLEGLLAQGYTLIKWDGITPRPLVSSTGQVFAVLAGRIPNDAWLDSCQTAFDAMKDEGRKADFSFQETHHCRGDFPAVNVGITMGHGATYPTNLSNGSHTEMMSRLLANPAIIRITNFMDSAFNLWAPNLRKSYSKHLNLLFEKLSYLRCIFDKCVFPTAAFNFGGNVVTKAHRDCMNAAIGWCGIIALGTFNPTESGHMVFPDLKLVVKYPPGSVIFIPSATLTHANLPVVNGECMSFTLYCSGGLLRYVDNGFRTKVQLQKDDPEKYARQEELNTGRWMEELKLYSFFDDLISEAK
ncbi:hypothetical protein H0H92_004757 [Tricholoma furcatifolium]|nr:hypothetical protein H0H92_004757 [Tricholoma furcatifolium]